MITAQVTEAVERRLGTMAAVGAGLLVVITAADLVADLRHTPTWWGLATVALLALAVLTSLGLGPLRLRVPTLRLLWRTLACCGLGLALVWAAVVPTGDLPWLYAFLPSLIGFASVGWRWRGATAYVAACALLPVGVAALAGSPALGLLWTNAPLTLTNVGFVAIFQGVRHQFTQLREAAGAAVARRVALASARAELAERARVSAFIHDDVLSALQAIVTAPGTDQTRDQAARARGMLADAGADAWVPRAVAVDLVPQLTALARDDGPPVTVSVPERAVLLPFDVADALAAAAREAVRNTARHAGAGASVRIVLTVLDDDDDDGSDAAGDHATVVLEISDDGVGFDPATIDPRRLGVTRTILGRLALHGGEVDVASAPGRGARLRLTWRQP